jgi:hypothetical protein
MKINNRDLFELEEALARGCKSKHWPLLKPWQKMAAVVSAAAGPKRDSLAPTAAMKSFQRALDRLRARNAGATGEQLAEMIRNLKREHQQAHIDQDEIRQLEIDMLADSTDVELEPIPEALLHDGDVLRVEPEAYFTLCRLELVKE